MNATLIRLGAPELAFMFRSNDALLSDVKDKWLSIGLLGNRVNLFFDR